MGPRPPPHLASPRAHPGPAWPLREAEAALASFERSVEAPAVAGAYRAVLFAHHGRTEEAKSALRGLEEARASGHVPPTLLARVHASLGEVEPGLSALEAARLERSFSLLFLAIDPDFESLRPDPSFPGSRRKPRPDRAAARVNVGRDEARVSLYTVGE